MEFISDCTTETISKAAQSLKDGHLVAFPTETVYGLGADATNEQAVSRIYSVKGRPLGHPLIVHISSINKMDNWATNIPDYAIKLAREFWPGPMTLILPRTDLAKDFITGGQNNVGLRVPAQPVAIELLKKFEDLGGFGVAAPSANRFGAVSPTSAEDVIDELGTYADIQDTVLNGGECSVGIESTIIDCTQPDPVILRPGSITREMLREKLGFITLNYNNKSIKVSGSFKKHYSPKTKIFLNQNPLPGQGLIALSNIETPNGVIRLLNAHDVNDFSKKYYMALRAGDKLKLKTVIVICPTSSGVGEALNDRIRRSASK